METIYFVLGVLTVLVALGVVGVFSVWKKAASAADEAHSVWGGIDSLNNDLGREIERLHQHVDITRKELNNDMNDIHLRIDQEFNELYRNLDSRLDKLEDRLLKMYLEGCEPVKQHKPIKEK